MVCVKFYIYNPSCELCCATIQTAETIETALGGNCNFSGVKISVIKCSCISVYFW